MGTNRPTKDNINVSRRALLPASHKNVENCILQKETMAIVLDKRKKIDGPKHVLKHLKLMKMNIAQLLHESRVKEKPVLGTLLSLFVSEVFDRTLEKEFTLKLITTDRFGISKTDLIRLRQPHTMLLSMNHSLGAQVSEISRLDQLPRHVFVTCQCAYLLFFEERCNMYSNVDHKYIGGRLQNNIFSFLKLFYLSSLIAHRRLRNNYSLQTGSVLCVYLSNIRFVHNRLTLRALVVNCDDQIKIYLLTLIKILLYVSMSSDELTETITI